MNNIKYIFFYKNGYPANLIEKVFLEVKSKVAQPYPAPDNPISESVPTQFININLPYAGVEGEHLMRKLKQSVIDKLLVDRKLRITYKSMQLSSKFQVKDPLIFANRHNCTYYAKCPDCDEDHIGEIGRRVNERVIDHNRRDKNSHILKHSREKAHEHVWLKDFKILNSNYSSKFKRAVSEALFIKYLEPSLNIQEKSYKLKLFN